MTEESSASDRGFDQLKITQPPRPDGAPCPIYVSYAWGGESEKMVDQIEAALTAQQFEFVRDKNRLRPGHWISTFMQEIGRAECVLLVLSDKSLKSVYCMRELLWLYQDAQGERSRLMQKVVPWIDPALQIDRAAQRAQYVRHWLDEERTLAAAYDGVALVDLGEADRNEWLAIKEFRSRVSDIVAWCADVLMPRGLGGQDAVIDELRRRAGGR